MNKKIFFIGLMLLITIPYAFAIQTGLINAKILCIDGDCRTTWPTGTSTPDGNYFSLYPSVDENLTHYYYRWDNNSGLEFARVETA